MMRSRDIGKKNALVLRRGRPGSKRAPARDFRVRAGRPPQHRALYSLLQRGKMGAALQFERRLAGLEADKAIVSYK